MRIPKIGRAGIYIHLFFLFAYFPVSGQRSEQWLSKNDRGSRFEGTYVQKIAEPAIEMVSLWGGFESFTYGESQTLKVRFFSPASSEYKLVAEELRIRDFYWMQNKEAQCEKGWNTFQPWPVDAWLHDLQIPKSNLAVRVELLESDSRKFSPAIVYKGSLPEKPKFYVAKLRLGKTYSEGICQVYKGLYEGVNPPSDQMVLEKPVGRRSAGSYFPLIIDVKKLDEPNTWYTVSLALKIAGSSRMVRYTYYFYHPGFEGL